MYEPFKQWKYQNIFVAMYILETKASNLWLNTIILSGDTLVHEILFPEYIWVLLPKIQQVFRLLLPVAKD